MTRRELFNMHKIILFIEPQDDSFLTPFKAGHSIMNRLSIDEDTNVEIVKIFELQKTSWKMSWSYANEPDNLSCEEEISQKGMIDQH